MFGKIDLNLNVGRKSYLMMWKVPAIEYDNWMRAQAEYPKDYFVESLNRTYWNFVDRWWWDNDGLNATQVHALLVTQMQRQQSKIERAEAMVAMGLEPHEAVRGQ